MNIFVLLNNLIYFLSSIGFLQLVGCGKRYIQQLSIDMMTVEELCRR